MSDHRLSFLLPLFLFFFFPSLSHTPTETYTHMHLCTYITEVLTVALVYLDEPVCEEVLEGNGVPVCVCVCCLNIENSSGFFFAPWDPCEPQWEQQRKLRKSKCTKRQESATEEILDCKDGTMQKLRCSTQKQKKSMYDFT